MEGLSLLIEDELLTQLAMKHSKWMARRNWINPYNLTLINNIAVGNTVDAVIRQWINQPETRTKMFGNYRKIGSGCFKSRYGIIYWTCIYL